MPELPKLKIEWLAQPSREITIDLEKAKYRLPFDSPDTLSITVDGQSIKSYDELVQIASQKRNRDKQFLEVVVIAPLSGG